MKYLFAFAAVAALLAMAGPAEALVEYSANFDTGQEGWHGDGESWSPTDGQDGGGYYYGSRQNYSNYLTPPDTSVLYGNVAANFENQIITFSYYLKDLSDSMVSPPQMYMFAANGTDDYTLWACTPEGIDMLEEWEGIPKEWTKYAYSLDPTATEIPEGWDNRNGGPLTWAESWQQVGYWNFWSGYGTSGVENSTGIDTVFITNDPEAIIVPPLGTPGDANLDGYVDVSDLGILATNYGTTSGAEWGDADFTGDGAVDVSDLGILATNYGATPPQAVPEPSVLVLIVFGTVMLAWRRK